MKNLDKRILLESLITEREGMIAENKDRMNLGQSIAYNDNSFQKIADEMKDLASSKHKQIILVPHQCCYICGRSNIEPGPSEKQLNWYYDQKENIFICPFCILKYNTERRKNE